MAGIDLIAALTALIGWLLFKDQPVIRLLHTLGQLKPDWPLLGLALTLAFVGCEATCSHLILGRLDHRAPLRHCLSYSFVGFYVSSIIPSTTGGQPAQTYYMSRDGVSAAHGALSTILIAVCHQVVVIGYALAVALLRFDLVANLGGKLDLLLLFDAVVNGALMAGMLYLMLLLDATRRLIGGVPSLLVRACLARRPEEAREKLGKQMEEYRRGVGCIRHGPALVSALLGLTFCQLTALFPVLLVVYYTFGLTGSRALDTTGTQALITLVVASLLLPEVVGASEGGSVAAIKPFFGAGLVTPAVLVSRDISFYSFLLFSGYVMLLVYLRTWNR